jgi:hypothetical protein
MTEQTASLHWRVAIKTAANYTKYLVEGDRGLLRQWSSFYSTGDVQKWARERIEKVLQTAEQLWLVFSDDKATTTDALSAARGWLESLAQAGFDGSVPFADISRTSEVRPGARRRVEL